MKKHFPSDILEVILILAILVSFIVPLLALNVFVLKFSSEIIFLVYISASFIIVLAMYYIVNRKNKVKIGFSFKIHNSIILLLFFILFYKLGIGNPLYNITIKEGVPMLSPLRVFSAIILTPIIEETVYRGIILKGLLTSYKPKKAVFIVSTLFACAHISSLSFAGIFNLTQAFILGVFLGVVYCYNKSLGMVIILHSLYNLLGIMSLYFNNMANPNKFLDIYNSYSIYIISGSFVLFILLLFKLFLLKKHFH